MAPELFDINDESQSNPPTPESDVPPSGVVTTEARNIRQSGLSTRESDMFALGMVTIEVRDAYRGGLVTILKPLVPSLRCSQDRCRSRRLRPRRW